MPGLKNAEKDRAVGFVLNGRRLEAAFQVTAVHKQARICVEVKGERLLEECLFLEPGQPCLRSLETAEGTQEKDISLFLLDESGKILVSYTFGPSFFQDPGKNRRLTGRHGSRRRYPRRRSCIWRGFIWSSTGM